MIPAHFKLQYPAPEIHETVARIGSEINTWAKGVWEDSHTDVLAVPILRGGVFFFADLVRAVECSLEVAPVKTWGYVTSVNSEQLEEVRIDMGDVPIRGRRVLLVDDICDSGKTLLALQERFLAGGALEVRSAVLIKRVIEEEIFNPDWVGFEYSGPEWFVGYGMEDAERWRNLPAVYIIQQS